MNGLFRFVKREFFGVYCTCVVLVHIKCTYTMYLYIYNVLVHIQCTCTCIFCLMYMYTYIYIQYILQQIQHCIRLYVLNRVHLLHTAHIHNMSIDYHILGISRLRNAFLRLRRSIEGAEHNITVHVHVHEL